MQEYWVAISFFQGIFPTQESNLCLLHLLHWWMDPLPLHHLGSPGKSKDTLNSLVMFSLMVA